tara:strand:- start:702 stop:1112 length:411 start_codon:yes stop_codon:yes gene_type:complete
MDYRKALQGALIGWAAHQCEHLFLNAAFGYNDQNLLGYHLIVSSLGDVAQPLFLQAALIDYGDVDCRFFDDSRLVSCVEYLFSKRPLKAGHHDHVRCDRLDSKIICPRIGRSCKNKCRHKRSRLDWPINHWASRYQ